MRLCIMPGLRLRLVQELNVVTIAAINRPTGFPFVPGRPGDTFIGMHSHNSQLKEVSLKISLMHSLITDTLILYHIVICF